MKYRVIENTYEDASLDYVLEIQKETNEMWSQVSGQRFKSEAKAVDYINEQIAASAANTLVSRVVLPGEYE